MASGLVKLGGALVGLAILSACSALRQAQGDMPIAPSNSAVNSGYGTAGGGYTTAARPNLSGISRYPAGVPDKKSNAKYYEYIINDYGTYASIFDYPKSTKQIDSIYNVGGQGCTNVLYGYGKSIVWIVAGANQISEYKVPTKLIKNLSVSIGAPSSCGMNYGGDLAVGILYGSGGGDIVIFKKAGGSGTQYSTGLIEEYFDGYDPDGNLFADGWNSGDNFQLVELPVGKKQFVNITTSNTVQFPGSVQWDGKYLTVVDQLANALYQYTVKGTKATLKGTVSFSGSSDCAQTWIVKGIIYCADAGNEGGEVFKYPAGGSPVAVFSGAFDLPLGTTAAQK